MNGRRDTVQLTIEQSQAHVFKQDVFEKRLSEWIVLAQAPFETVDSDAFKELIRSLNKKARVHGPDTIKRRIMKLFDALLAKRDEMAKAIPGLVSFTCNPAIITS